MQAQATNSHWNSSASVSTTRCSIGRSAMSSTAILAIRLRIAKWRIASVPLSICSVMFRPLFGTIHLGASGAELGRLLGHAGLERDGFIDAVLGGVIAHVLGDLHRA